ncbi:MAG: hypothetical protein JW789_00800 [Candidatus Aenigmarchaeota archaeon]|nr:hypothetical protein [Candidatus Aenigmarchaeota archaeon]
MWNLGRNQEMIPDELREIYTPLQIHIPDSVYGNNNTWMGHAINPQREDVSIPIGAVYYSLWGNRYAEKNGTSHVNIIVDDPLIHDEIPEKLVREKSEIKMDKLEKIKDHFSLGSTENMRWDFFKECNGDYCEDYARRFESITQYIKSNPEFAEKIKSECIPDKYRNFPNSMRYIIDEMTAVLTMTDTGYALRFGHLPEKSLDRRIWEIVDDSEFREFVDVMPGVIYLRGDYSLSSQDYKNKILPPSKEWDPKRRITLNDNISEVREKVESSTKFYRGWLKSILNLADLDISNIDTGNLADAVYEGLIQPLQK